MYYLGDSNLNLKLIEFVFQFIWNADLLTIFIVISNSKEKNSEKYRNVLYGHSFKNSIKNTKIIQQFWITENISIDTHTI